MAHDFARVRRQKHIWQIAFVVLAIAFFVQTYFLYKDDAAIADKVKRVFSLDARSTLEIEGFLQGQAVRNHPLEMKDIARPVNGT